jgi:type IV secretion system protein VirD4
MGKGNSVVSRSTLERPLLEPGEIRALPDDRQLVFVAGQKPLRATKLKYDRREPFRTRARVAAPDQALRLDTPPAPFHPWAGRRSVGRDEAASLPLFKEVAAAMEDKKTAARVAEVMGRVTQEMAASEAVLNHLQGRANGED